MPPEAVFLHRFAALRAGAGKTGKKAKKKGGGDGLSDSEGEGDSGSDAEIGSIPSPAVLCGQPSLRLTCALGTREDCAEGMNAL